jgi:large subunit ribosomal protein L10
MNRQQKEVIISDIKKLFSGAQATFLIYYKGLDVAHLQSLRKNLRENQSVLKVTKANLMRIAISDIEGTDGFKDQFKDQVGLVFVNGDVPSAAKKLTAFSKENESLKIISGFFEAKTLDQKTIETIASLPPREILIAQLLATMQAPISGLVGVLQQLIARPLNVLKQISEKK